MNFQLITYYLHTHIYIYMSHVFLDHVWTGHDFSRKLRLWFSVVRPRSRGLMGVRCSVCLCYWVHFFVAWSGEEWLIYCIHSFFFWLLAHSWGYFKKIQLYDFNLSKKGQNGDNRAIIQSIRSIFFPGQCCGESGVYPGKTRVWGGNPLCIGLQFITEQHPPHGMISGDGRKPDDPQETHTDTKSIQQNPQDHYKILFT